MRNAVKAKSLNDAQIMVLQIIKNDANKEDLEDLRELLLDFNGRKMREHLDETIALKGYETADFENMLTGHMRKVH
jgi:hypothetical protein